VAVALGQFGNRGREQSPLEADTRGLVKDSRLRILSEGYREL
jgi:hypothetical protein